MSQLLLIIDNNTLKSYSEYYFGKYPGRRKFPIESPHHPSINKWMIMKRMPMNNLKSKWKEFVVWFVEENGLTNKKIEKCTMTFVSFFKTKVKKDCDNQTPKFLLDGFVEAGLIVDDDFFHLESITIRCGYDKLNPRTEIYIDY